jgi:hypothetical protein
MKKLILYVALILNLSAFSQDEKTVTLVVSGQGKTQDEAKQNALRSAIEQAFGTFISSKTEILNDSLVKDEIVSISNGNIQKIEIISEVQIPNGGYASTIKATVSITKLTSFVESKGVEVEFKGGLFASNILLQELYEKNEKEVINRTIPILNEIANKSFDYSIKVGDPILDRENWRIPIAVNVIANSNFTNIPAFLERTIKSISLSSSEVENYRKLNKSVFLITLATIDSKGIYYLRNKQSLLTIIEYIYSLNNSIINFSIFNGMEKKQLIQFSNLFCYENFKIILNHSGKAVSIFSDIIDYRRGINNNFDYKSIIYDRHIQNLLELFYFKRSNNDNFDQPYTFKNERMESFLPLKKLILNNKELGLVISFASIRPNKDIVQFIVNDYKTIDEIKRITKYEVIKKD